jgi:hypothetical protein
MPPKFPHGLTKDPTIMSRPELAIFGALVGSMGIGIYQLITSPWGETPSSNINKDDSSTTSTTTATARTTFVDPAVMSSVSDDSGGVTTKVVFEKSQT